MYCIHSPAFGVSNWLTPALGWTQHAGERRWLFDSPKQARLVVLGMRALHERNARGPDYYLVRVAEARACE